MHDVAFPKRPPVATSASKPHTHLTPAPPHTAPGPSRPPSRPSCLPNAPCATPSRSRRALTTSRHVDDNPFPGCLPARCRCPLIAAAASLRRSRSRPSSLAPLAYTCNLRPHPSRTTAASA
ncbi:hypothetical protein C8F04DRAFT_1250288 [Mycena alexandri]|uniref:Uncharacterized protein n=1 Tax=Mycena alexandri TaxID=1745969 RepID=A0AAD6XDT8_9AGAR|nr:hypothetical protein C8F04DRAFT_1250288 [Mycena alexandri]